MKKHNGLLLILVIVCCNAVHAQDEFNAATSAQVQGRPQPPTTQPLHRWSFDVLAGPAIPVGQYASYNEQNRSVAPVKTGGLLELSGNYRMSASFAFTLVLNGQINPIKDRPSDVHIITTSNGGPYVPSPYDSRWKIARLMTGGTYTIPLNKDGRFNLLARVLGGLQKARTAGFTEGYIGNSNDPGPFNPTTLPWTFTYEGDVGFKWKTCRHLALIAYAGYNGSLSNYTLTYPILYYIGPSNPPPIKNKADLPTASILLRAGMEWDL